MSAPNSATATSKPVSKSYWKGKAKATENDFNDLNPTITYRHLHSNNLGVRDPLRVVALCDSDAFYAACEQVRLALDPALPLVVQQWDSLIAVNYPARTYGISRMDKIRDARKRCPDLVVVHVATYREGEAEPGYWENPDTRTHKVSLDHYRRESMKIIQLFKEGLPGGEVEKASIDEAFIDFTRPVREELLKRYPYLAVVPPDAPNGVDSPLPPPPPISWDGLATIVPVNPPKEPPKEQDLPAGESVESTAEDQKSNISEPTDDDEVVEEDDSLTTWHDVALSIAAELMLRIREDIRTKLGYTTSAGIARNKFLAKLTASYKKPMNQTVLRNAAIPNYLKPMAFQKIRFLGGKLGKALAEEYDVSTVGDLLTISLEEMQRKFGEDSIWVYEILRGIDRSEVKEKSAVNKSMLASKNLPQPITKATQGYHWIRVLAAELALRLNEAREANTALWPKTIVLHIRQGYETSKSKQTPFPFTKTVTVDVIAAYGDKLWKELVGPGGSTPFNVTNVQLSFSGIGIMETGQRSIEGFLAARRAIEEQTVTQTEAAEGSTSKPPSALKRKRSASPTKEPRQSDLQDQAVSSARPSAINERDEQFSFVCEKCGQRVWLGDADAARDVDADGRQEHAGAFDAIREEALAALRLEHADFHFAQELAASADGNVPKRVIRPVDRPAPAAKKKKSKKKSGEEGIAKFFSKR
ncbi:DNA/RNA polymerase [Trametes versicolor FP-101664 SS1]|uniref:DNA/RNA polymerase n=1 Tax=Trametes versicolor (strain FP-101664) TaxID=717944 RepID=UPI0004624344|nr:DNA/RNA polymerase [Trametes versicolor FP-101664 SS1]EIW57746.1 DNA/RNA polymerase [Trametes versicolor FP-101664 SS1]